MELTVIAIADTSKFINTGHQILFLNGMYRNKSKYHLVKYHKKIKPMKVMIDKCDSCGHWINMGRELQFNSKYPINWQDDVVSDVRQSIEQLQLHCKNDHYELFKFHCYWILYFSHGSFAVFTKQQIIYQYLDIDMTYQSGDQHSMLIELSNGDLIIQNSGDVESCLLFSVYQPHLYKIDGIHHWTMDCLTHGCKLCDKAKNIKMGDIKLLKKSRQINTIL